MLLPLVLLAIPVLSAQHSPLPPLCPSPIFCYGSLLHDVQMSGFYKDSKSFVDLKLKCPPEEVLFHYEELKEEIGNKTIDKDDIGKFLEANFEVEESLEVWEPEDWQEEPRLLAKVRDPELQRWARRLNLLWKQLSRKLSTAVRDQPHLYSIIYVPNGFIIPGGRFKELYYWDTYWIIKGLMYCGMLDTSRGIIENLLSLVERYNHVPNGNRVYYIERSQPPMLIQMMEWYLKFSKNHQFLEDNFHLLDREMNWWLANRTVTVNANGRRYSMFRYRAESYGPRPESYREDFITVSQLKDGNDRREKYIALKSAAESGWDFSSRWFRPLGEERGLIDTDTSNIIPVDLNALLQKNFALMAKWAARVKRPDLVTKYNILCESLQEAINDVLWQGYVWLDYDLQDGRPRNQFLISNLVPLWTGSYTRSRTSLTHSILTYLEKNNITSFIGGSPTSLEWTGQQWDFPNAWPPLQAFLIQGLDRLATPEARQTAFRLASLWIRSNYDGFKNYNKMFEKYNSLLVGKTGNGGEYEAQTGFGWSNGVTLEFLYRWGSALSTRGYV